MPTNSNNETISAHDEGDDLPRMGGRAVKHTPGRIGFDEAVEAIVAGQAEAHALWMLLSSEDERDGYWLRPMPWEGSGEYQRVSYKDGRNGLVRVPGTGTSLNESAERSRRAIAKALPTHPNQTEGQSHGE